jgi:hypothetical protein
VLISAIVAALFGVSADGQAPYRKLAEETIEGKVKSSHQLPAQISTQNF